MAKSIMCKNESCNKSVDKDSMIVHTWKSESGKTTYKKQFCSQKCYDEFLSHQEFINKEKEERDYLDSVIKEIHEIHEVPNHFWSMKIQALRNGSVMYGNKRKRYKEGFSFKLIADTYIYCKKTIQDVKKKKSFDSALNELSYCWAIINDKINIVKKKQDAKRRKEAQSKKQEEITGLSATIVYDEIEFKKSKTKDKNDASGFLD